MNGNGQSVELEVPKVEVKAMVPAAMTPVELLRNRSNRRTRHRQADKTHGFAGSAGKRTKQASV